MKCCIIADITKKQRNIQFSLSLIELIFGFIALILPAIPIDQIPIGSPKYDLYSRLPICIIVTETTDNDMLYKLIFMKWFTIIFCGMKCVKDLINDNRARKEEENFCEDLLELFDDIEKKVLSYYKST